MSVFLAALGSGIGDMVVLLPILQSTIARGIPTIFVSKSQRQSELAHLVPGLNQIIDWPSFNFRKTGSDDIYIDFQTNEIVQTAALSYESGAIRPQINQLLANACRQVNLNVDFSVLTPLAHTTNQQALSKILFIAGTTSNSKTWPLSYWLELREYLNNKGERCALLGEPDTSLPVRELQEHGLNVIPTPTMADALNVISSSKLIVSVDTGLMHLAVHQGINTISFFNHDSFWRRDYQNLFALITDECKRECKEYGRMVDQEVLAREYVWSEGRTWSEADFYFCRVSEEDRCISSIKPQRVIEVLEDNSL